MQINITLDGTEPQFKAIMAAAGMLSVVLPQSGAAAQAVGLAGAALTVRQPQPVNEEGKDAQAAQPEKPKVGRPKKQTATQADPVPEKEPEAQTPPAEPKAEGPRKVDDAEMRDALKRVAAKAGNGDEIGGIAKVEEILGQFGVQDRRKLTPEQTVEAYDLCMAYLAG